MDIAYIGYLLFVVPGFCLCWTYRHFTNAKKIGEFEYAAWSFLWGVALFFLTAWFISNNATAPLPSVDLNNQWSVVGALLGMGIGIALSLSFPLGYVGAILSRTKIFMSLDRFLFWIMEKMIGSNKKSDEKK